MAGITYVMPTHWLFIKDESGIYNFMHFDYINPK
jgi:hypothetical protein